MLQQKQLTTSLIIKLDPHYSNFKESINSLMLYGKYFERIVIAVDPEDFPFIELSDLNNTIFHFNKIHNYPDKNFYALIENVKTDYIIFLQRNDILQNGILEINRIIQEYGHNHDIIILGSYHFICNDNTSFSSSEISFLSEGIDQLFFIEQEISKPYLINVSGTVIPIKVLVKNKSYFIKNCNDILFEHLLVACPSISRIFQTKNISVKIRLKETQLPNLFNDTIKKKIENFYLLLYKYNKYNKQKLTLKILHYFYFQDPRSIQMRNHVQFFRFIISSFKINYISSIIYLLFHITSIAISKIKLKSLSFTRAV